MISKLEELRSKRVETLAILDGMATRALTTEEQASFDELVASVADIDARLVAIEDQMIIVPVEENSSKIVSLKKNQRKSVAINAPNFVVDINDKKAKKNTANSLRAWLTKGTPAFRNEMAVAAHETGIDLNSNTLTFDARVAQGIGSTGIGGALINSGFYDTLTSALRDYNSVLGVATIINTDTGSALNFPTIDDTAVTGELLAENGTSAQTAFTVATTTLGAYKYSSKTILTSFELFQDSLIDIETLVAEVAGQRLGRITAAHMTLGTGSSQPKGIVIAANASTAVASTTAITAANILTLVGNVDPAHRNAPGVAFMMNSTTLNQVASIMDDNGRPIFVTNYVDGSGRLPTILGYPVYVNNNMDSAAATKKPIIFGNLGAYIVRQVTGQQGLTLVRQNETYGHIGQIGWTAFMRMDSNILTGNATTYSPIWSLLMAAS